MATIEVPITIVSTPAANLQSTVAIGPTNYGPPSQQDNSYWFSVYDRNTLHQVYSVVQARNGDAVPADLAGKFNTPQYFLVVSTRTLMTAFVPAGPLHAFLIDNGGGVELKRLTQFFQQIGCGTIGTVSYAMAGVLGPGPAGHASVEASSLGVSGGALYLEATLVGAVVPTGTVFTPFSLTPPAP